MAHLLLLGQRLDQRHAGDGVGVDQRRARQVDHRGDLARVVDHARLVFERAEHLVPAQRGAQQQQRQQEEGAPEQAEAERRALLLQLWLQRRVAGVGELIGPRAGRPDIRHRRRQRRARGHAEGALGHDRQLVPSGTNT